MKANETAHQIQGQVNSQLDKQRQAGTLHEHPNFGRLLKPGSSEVLMRVSENLHDGKGRVGDVMRAMKHDSDSAPALLAKYVVHRVNNADKYGAANDDALDQHFIKHHRTHTNDHVEASDLQQWLAKNPHLVSGMIKHRDMLHNWIRRGVGLNVRKNDGKEYVALTRGLADSYKDDTHSLVPFSDQEDSGYGNVQHAIWVPMDDIWFAYPAAPEWVRGPLGHQNEFLVSNRGQRFRGRSSDVKASRFKDVPQEYLSIDGKHGATEDLMEPIFDDAIPSRVANTPWAKGYFSKYPERITTAPIFDMVKEEGFLDHKFMPRAEAIAALQNAPDGSLRGAEALGNPNLAPEDLIALIRRHNVLDPDALQRIAKNPNYNDKVAAALVLKASEDPQHLGHTIATVLSSPNAPERIGHMLMDGILRGDDWASEAVFGIHGRGMTPDLGDKIINSVLRARTENPLWGGTDIAPLFAQIPMTDLTLKHLVDSEKHVVEPGEMVFYDGAEGSVDKGLAERALYQVGRYNVIDPRSAALLSSSPSALRGMAEREDWLPRPAQEAIASRPSPIWERLAARQDLLPDVVNSMLENLRKYEPTKNEFSAKHEYSQFVKSVVNSLANNPSVHWQDLWNSVQDKNVAAPKIIEHLSPHTKSKWAEHFDYTNGILEGELLNAIVRKRLGERNLGAEDKPLSQFPEAHRG